MFREMSEEEVEEEFSDTAGEEGDPPAAEWGVPPLDAWIVELVAKVAASQKLSEADQVRLPTALQLQNQHAIAVQQAKAEAAAQKVAEQQSARDSEILLILAPGVLTTTTESSIVLFLFGKPTSMLMRIVSVVREPGSGIPKREHKVPTPPSACILGGSGVDKLKVL